MTVVHLDSPSLNEIARVRVAAGDLLSSLLYAHETASKALAKLRSAKTLDKVLRFYAEWLGSWYRSNVTLTFSMHTRDGINGHHVVAYFQVKHGIASAQSAIDQRSHWMAMPNLENTRFNLIAVLNDVLSSIDRAIEGCSVLQGHQSKGKTE